MCVLTSLWPQEHVHATYRPFFEYFSVVLPEERAEIGDFLLEDVLEAPVLGEVLEGAVGELALHLPRLAARRGDAAVTLVEHLQHFGA